MLEGLILALIVGVVFVNGWTDAPNAIACAVSTKAMDYRRAAWMAGICNLLGLLTVSATGAAVTDTIISLVDFGGDSRAALIALSAAMASIILFAVAAWRFGIPTSESHALIASLTGAAFALNKAPGIDKTAWGKVLAGLLRSFGAKVMVAARKWSDLAWVRVAGCQSVHLSEMAEHLPSADLIINTVPSLLFEEDKLALLKRSCLIIDLASKPGGVDLEAAKTLGLKAEWALSLPGKVAPVTAGVITLDTIFNILHERGAIP